MIFRGITENRGENCFQIIRDLIYEHLDLDSDRMYIARAHRLGKFDRHSTKHRPIVVNFRDYCDVEIIMNNPHMLKGKTISIDDDFLKEIQEARSTLWSLYKRMKGDNPEAKIQTVYPAKLLKNGRLVKDELIEWSSSINNNRLELVQKISAQPNILNESAHSYLPQTQESFPNFGLIQSHHHATLSTSNHMKMNTTASQISNHSGGGLQNHMAARVTVEKMHTEQVSSDLNIYVNPTPLHSDNSDNQMMHSLSDTAALVSSSLSVAADDNLVSKQSEMHYENNARQT